MPIDDQAEKRTSYASPPYRRKLGILIFVVFLLYPLYFYIFVQCGISFCLGVMVTGSAGSLGMYF